MEQRSLHPIAVPARRNSSGSCQREQKNRRNKNEEPIKAYHNEYIIFGDCDSGANTIRESTKYCLPHGSDQQCAHVRTAAPLNFSSETFALSGATTWRMCSSCYSGACVRAGRLSLIMASSNACCHLLQMVGTHLQRLTCTWH